MISPTVKLRRLKTRAFALALTALALGTTPTLADGDSFVIKAKRVYPVAKESSEVFEPGMVIVRDGLVVAVGKDLAIPPDLKVINLKDAHVVPGFIAAANSMTPKHAGDESVAAGYLALDAFDNYGDFQEALAEGVTTVHLDPGSHRLLTGQGAIVRLGGSPMSRILNERSDLTINFNESAYGPPNDVTYQTPASSDVAIPPGVRQRPDSRLGQFVALEEALRVAESGTKSGLHPAALTNAWRNNAPLRIHVDRSVDITGAVRFLYNHKRSGYLVGGAQADITAQEIAEAHVPLVFVMGEPLDAISNDLGPDPDVVDRDIQALKKLRGATIALAPPAGARVDQLRLSAATAMRAGLTEAETLAAITRIPAEILGIDDRTGSIERGKQADLVIMSGPPLETSSHVKRVYVGGLVAFEAPYVDAVVVHAGTIWIDENTRIEDGSVLIEKGRISAVGTSVPRPRFADYIDAGANSFVTPGFIDAFGHLGLDGDTSSLNPNLSLASMVGVPDVSEHRVAMSGVTTVLTAPYAASPQGSQIAAIKTAGTTRDKRLVRNAASVYFDVRKGDPAGVLGKLKPRLEAGKKYLEKWQKYEKELAEWKEKKAKGEKIEIKKNGDALDEEAQEEDPITGTWEVTISGGPIPEPQQAKMLLKLDGADIEGRIRIPGQPDEAKVTATFDGKHVSGQIDVETPFGPPAIEADLTEPDHLVGELKISDIVIDLDATRTDKEDVQFKVVKSRKRGKDGRPLPPKTDDGLEPIRAALEKKIPLLIAASNQQQIAQVLKLASEFEVGIVLLDAEGAAVHFEKLIELAIGVVVPTKIVRWLNHTPYHQADDLSRKGVSVAFQSDAEDGARSLRNLGLHAVQRGMSPDAALSAFTTRPSKMFKLEDEIGSLKKGCHGDLVIFDGHPFEARTRVKRVLVGGEEVE